MGKTQAAKRICAQADNAASAAYNAADNADSAADSAHIEYAVVGQQRLAVHALQLLCMPWLCFGSTLAAPGDCCCAPGDCGQVSISVEISDHLPELL